MANLCSTLNEKLKKLKLLSFIIAIALTDMVMAGGGGSNPKDTGTVTISGRPLLYSYHIFCTENNHVWSINLNTTVRGLLSGIGNGVGCTASFTDTSIETPSNGPSENTQGHFCEGPCSDGLNFVATCRNNTHGQIQISVECNVGGGNGWTYMIGEWGCDCASGMATQAVKRISRSKMKRTK